MYGTLYSSKTDHLKRPKSLSSFYPLPPQDTSNKVPSCPDLIVFVSVSDPDSIRPVDSDSDSYS